MLLPPINPISREQLPGAPSWIDPLIYNFNQLVISLVSGLNYNLSLYNEDIEEKTFMITAGASASDNTFTFIPRKNNPPRSLVITKITRSDGVNQVFTAAPYASWNTSNSGLVVSGITGLTDGIRYTITILVRYS